MVDELTMGEVGDLLRGWDDAPPAAVSLAQIATVLKQVFCEEASPKLDVSAVMRPKKQEEGQGNLAELLAMFPDGQIKAVL